MLQNHPEPSCAVAVVAGDAASVRAAARLLGPVHRRLAVRWGPTTEEEEEEDADLGLDIPTLVVARDAEVKQAQ